MLDKVYALALLRIGLGVAQVMGATAIVVLLLRTGTSAPTAVAALVTLACTIVSRMVFATADD